MNMKADVPGWGEVWFDPNCMTNIFSYAQMADRYPITYDNQKEDAFIVHLPHKSVKFMRENGLYLYRPPYIKQTTIKDNKSESNMKVQFLETVNENKKFYMKRQFEHAQQARRLLYSLGYPSINDLKAIIQMNAIKNNPVTTEDVDIAQKIFGPNIATLKGKTTRRTPVPIIEDRIKIPRELITTQYAITLCIDGMKVNDIGFLTTISKNIMYRTARYISRLLTSIYRKCLQQVLRIYTLGGFRVTMIHCDNEFCPLIDPLALEFGIQVNYASPQEHVPEAERNNRVVKERVRATYHHLPYERLPRIMIKVLVDDSAKKLNFFPAKNGISPYYSPRMILHQRNLDYDKHCQYSFGTYVQAHDEPDPSNTNAPRTLDGIYLCYNDNEQGGHDVLHLQTNRIITRRRVTPIPITPAIIKMVHRIAENDGMPKGLKITNNTGQVLYDSTWIAGVDYEEEEFEDEDFEPDSDEESDDSDDYKSDDSKQEDMYDEMDPDDIAALAEPITMQQDEDSEVSEEDQQPQEDPDEEEEPEEESEDEQDPNPTTAQEQTIPENTRTTRSGRISKPREVLNLHQSHLQTEPHQEVEYSIETARVIAVTMCHLNTKIGALNDEEAHQFIQTYSLKSGLKKFKERGEAAAMKEMRQLHERVVFEPIRVADMTELERKRAMESLIFLTEKHDGTVKARTCANGSTQREYMERDDAASPTAMTESILITATIEAKQNRDVMTADIPNAFVQTAVDEKNQVKGEHIIMKIRGPLVDMLLEIAPEVYSDYVAYEGKTKVLYVKMLMAIYGMLQSSLLYYKKF